MTAKVRLRNANDFTRRCLLSTLHSDSAAIDYANALLVATRFAELASLQARRIQHNALKLGLEPVHRVVLGKTVRVADARLLHLATSDTSSWTLQHDEEVHAVNARRRVVLDTQINVFLDTKTEVARLREVLAQKFVLLHLKTAVKNLLGEFPTNRHVARNLFVTTNTERADRVASWSYKQLLHSHHVSTFHIAQLRVHGTPVHYFAGHSSFSSHYFASISTKSGDEETRTQRRRTRHASLAIR